jgi:putative DNA primase/helicase
MAKTFDQTGVMQVNGAWATRVKYAAEVLGPNAGTVDVRFMQGRAEVVRVSLSREQLGEVLGEANRAAIERHVANDADKYLSVVSGELRGRRLHYRDVTLPAADLRTQENSIAAAPTQTSERRPVENSVRTAERAAQNRARDAASTKEAVTSTGTAAESAEHVVEGTQEKGTERSQRAGAGPSAESVAGPPAPVPAHIAAKYLVKGNTYHFDDQTVAFVDKGTRLTAKTHNKAIIQDLVAIAKSRDWQEVTVAGTQAFRRAAWKEAYVAGLTVIGYTPSDIERAAVERERGHRAAPTEKSPAERKNPEPGRGSGSVPSDSPSDPRLRQSEKGVVYGRLVAHGEAPYQHDGTKSASYFVTIKDASGRERTSWGVGLGEAIRESKTAPAVNDQVGIRRTGATPVTVVQHSIDDQGTTVSQPIEAKRNQWVVEKAEYFEREPGVKPDLPRQPVTPVERTAVQTTTEGAPQPLGTQPMTREQEAAAAIRSAATTREELQLKYPELNKAVFQHLASHDQFAEAFVKAGLIRESDRAQVIAQMRDRLATKLEQGGAIKEPNNKEVKALIRRSVNRVAADIGRQPIEIEPRTPEQMPTRTTVAREDVQVRA